jgi:glycosyltransferase involved in cell wall biosynthesis
MVRLSVVLAVYNGARSLARTLDGIAAQTMADYELIAIDDGSTDDTPAILAAYADSDPRLRVITQANAGLTRALIRGCEEARADVIARHDCGDVSHGDRFARQLALIDQGHVLAASYTRTVTPEGDVLYVTRQEGDEVRASLLHDDAASIRGIVHGASMFRRDAYRAAGGYRPQFRVAQDLDLWIRLASLGTIGIVDDVLYDVEFQAASISGASRDAQLRLTQIAVALRDGGDEAALLDQAARVVPGPRTRGHEAAALYFIGKCLLDQRNPKGRDYLRHAVRRNPLH